MMVFFQARVVKILIWQKFSEPWESGFKEEYCREALPIFQKLQKAAGGDFQVNL